MIGLERVEDVVRSSQKALQRLVSPSLVLGLKIESSFNPTKQSTKETMIPHRKITREAADET